MVTGVNTETTVAVVSNSSNKTGRVQAVSAVAPRPKLPGEGKTLPSGDKKTNDDAAVDPKAMEEALREFEQQAQLVQRELHFSIDKDSGRTVIKVMDASTQELVRQIPSDEALRFARKLSQGEKLELFNSFT